MRKFIGYALLIVNTILSLLGFLAVYGVVNFLSDQNNYHFSPLTSGNFTNIFNSTSEPKYINVGSFVFNNTSLFSFDDFDVNLSISLHNDTRDYRILDYNGTFGSIAAGQMRNISLYLTTTSTSTLIVDPLVLLGKIHPMGMNVSNSSYIDFTGKYVFDLFHFDLNITTLSTLFTTFW